LVVTEEILIQNIATKYGSWLNIFCYSWRNADVIMCHGYKNWLFQLVLSVATLLRWWKIWFADDKFLKFYSCSHKNVQSNCIYVSVKMVGLSHVRARQYTSTQNLQNCCAFGSQDAWFHFPMLLSLPCSKNTMVYHRKSTMVFWGGTFYHGIPWYTMVVPWYTMIYNGSTMVFFE